jgi:hypothetical protein
MGKQKAIDRKRGMEILVKDTHIKAPPTYEPGQAPDQGDLPTYDHGKMMLVFVEIAGSETGSSSLQFIEPPNADDPIYPSGSYKAMLVDISGMYFYESRSREERRVYCSVTAFKLEIPGIYSRDKERGEPLRKAHAQASKLESEVIEAERILWALTRQKRSYV